MLISRPMITFKIYILLPMGEILEKLWRRTKIEKMQANFFFNSRIKKIYIV